MWKMRKILRRNVHKKESRSPAKSRLFKVRHKSGKLAKTKLLLIQDSSFCYNEMK